MWLCNYITYSGLEEYDSVESLDAELMDNTAVNQALLEAPVPTLRKS
jgi:hypothetical protein